MQIARFFSFLAQHGSAPSAEAIGSASRCSIYRWLVSFRFSFSRNCRSPQLLFWAFAVSAGVWVVASSGRRGVRIAAVVVLLSAISAWYCVAYIPGQLKRMANHRGDAAAPEFTFQRVSEGAVPTKTVPGKIFVIDFFGTWCPPCIAELPEIERVRADLQDKAGRHRICDGRDEFERRYAGKTASVRAPAPCYVANGVRSRRQSALRIWSERLSRTGSDRSQWASQADPNGL